MLGHDASSRAGVFKSAVISVVVAYTLFGSSSCALDTSKYPPLDLPPPTDSAVVKEWLSKIDMSKVPAIAPTGMNGCDNATNAAAVSKGGSDGSCWWTCGKCTRDTDVTVCPQKNTWGLTYDDGPTQNTLKLLDYLQQHNLKATFFVVSSRVLENPDILKKVYDAGNDIKLHTHSHRSLTTLTNEQIVAEFAWSIKILQDVLGVTINELRPPYGDVDDRVRYIAKQMGLKIIIWTATSSTRSFDTEDWRTVTGEVTPEKAFQNFQNMLSQAANMSTGFIALSHDLFPQTVSLAIERILPAALSSKTLKIEPLSTCLGETAPSGNKTASSGGMGAMTHAPAASSNTSSTSTSAAGTSSTQTTRSSASGSTGMTGMSTTSANSTASTKATNATTSPNTKSPTSGSTPQNLPGFVAPILLILSIAFGQLL